MNRLALQCSYITQSLRPNTAYYSSKVFYYVYYVVMDSGIICMCSDQKKLWIRDERQNLFSLSL